MTMTMTERLIAELTQEASTTRRVLERVPEDKLGWKPHPKSMSLGQLAMHIALLPHGISDLLGEAVREVPAVPLPQAQSREELMLALDRSIAFALDKLWQWGDRGLEEGWRLNSEGKTLLEMQRGAFFRSVMLNHWYHHRGQLALYLRLLDVPVPPIYGPTADENPFA